MVHVQPHINNNAAGSWEKEREVKICESSASSAKREPQMFVAGIQTQLATRAATSVYNDQQLVRRVQYYSRNQFSSY